MKTEREGKEKNYEASPNPKKKLHHSTCTTKKRLTVTSRELVPWHPGTMNIIQIGNHGLIAGGNQCLVLLNRMCDWFGLRARLG